MVAEYMLGCPSAKTSERVPGIKSKARPLYLDPLQAIGAAPKGARRMIRAREPANAAVREANIDYRSGHELEVLRQRDCAGIEEVRRDPACRVR